MLQTKTIRDVEVAGKIVLVRTDYNVPLAEDPETEVMHMTLSLIHI